MTVVTKPEGYVLIVGGPCGCGKSSVAQGLAEKLKIGFLEGDEVHPKKNVDKMSNGIPLTDEDRWGWLESIVNIGSEQIVKNKKEKSQSYSVISCSSLKKSYRDFLINGFEKIDPSTKVIFIFIDISIEDSKYRVSQRKNHYMKPNMVDSQFKILETPKDEEILKTKEDSLIGNSIVIDPSQKGKDEILNEVWNDLKDLSIIN